MGVLQIKNMVHFKSLLTLPIFCLSLLCNGQESPLLKVSDDGSHLVTEDNLPFFWLGDTAWELIHRLDRAEVDVYLEDRAEQGFNVIQTVILAELDGLNTANAYGELPLIDNDPTNLNEKYFKHVDYVLNKANQLGLYVGLLPTWGDKFNRRSGAGPEVFDAMNAEVYGRLLAERYYQHRNIIWILGGDRALENATHYAVIRAMAKGIRQVHDSHLMTFHPVGARRATDFFDDDWLDFDMYQSGHSSTAKEYSYVVEGMKEATRRPIINGEARYENIQDRFWEKEFHGWLDDADVRVSAYWTILAGAAGYTYGCNDIWQMYDIDKEPIIGARTGWETALQLPGSRQMKYLKQVFELLHWHTMKPDQSLILGENSEDHSYKMAAIGENHKFIVAYTPVGDYLQVDLTKIDADSINAYWFNPRSGKVKRIGEFQTHLKPEFTPWSQGHGSDFLLILVAQDSTIDPTVLNN